MITNWNYIIVKILLIIMVLLIFYFLTNKNNNETFIDAIENEKTNYLKMKETYVEPTDTSLELLYANYSGEEVGSDIWKNKTLDQCINTCNNLEGCSGFSRDSVLDTEPANCYPRTTINNCHSNRKGDFKQMQKAIKFDSYVKSNVSNVLNNCIGDSDLTLNRLIFIKSYLQPNNYIGIMDDSKIVLVKKDTDDFKSKCNFRLEAGKDGVGTISFLHIDTNRYLYRDLDNNIILKDISSGKTIDNQRSSFNLYDGISGSIMLKAMKLEGETTDKFIMLDDKTNYLVAKTLSSTNSINKFKNNNSNSKSNSKSNSNSNSKACFYIVDSIVSSNIITNKNSVPFINTENTENNITNSKSTLYEEFKNINEGFNLNLDTKDNIPIYNRMFSGTENMILSDYLQDTYLTTESQQKNPVLIKVSNKLNDIAINKQLSTSLNKNQDEFNSLNELNKEIEVEIENLNSGLNNKNNLIINKLDKMRISDLANDYFFLKYLPTV